MRVFAQKCARIVVLFVAMAATLTTTVACGNGGSIQFQPGTGPVTNNRGAASSMVPASQALAIESGKTTANGFHAKVQLNFQKGTKVTGSGYEVELKHTVRNQ